MKLIGVVFVVRCKRRFKHHVASVGLSRANKKAHDFRRRLKLKLIVIENLGGPPGLEPGTKGL